MQSSKKKKKKGIPNRVRTRNPRSLIWDTANTRGIFSFQKRHDAFPVPPRSDRAFSRVAQFPGGARKLLPRPCFSSLFVRVSQDGSARYQGIIQTKVAASRTVATDNTDDASARNETHVSRAEFAAPSTDISSGAASLLSRRDPSVRPLFFIAATRCGSELCGECLFLFFSHFF